MLVRGEVAWMARGKEKVRAGIYIEKEVLEMADSLLPAANVRSRNEFEPMGKSIQPIGFFLNVINFFGELVPESFP